MRRAKGGYRVRISGWERPCSDVLKLPGHIDSRLDKALFSRRPLLMVTPHATFEFLNRAVVYWWGSASVSSSREFCSLHQSLIKLPWRVIRDSILDWRLPGTETLPACVFLAFFSADKIFGPMSVCTIFLECAAISLDGISPGQKRGKCNLLSTGGAPQPQAKEQNPQLC